MKKILLILLFAFVMIQFFPIDKINPPVNRGMDFLTVKNTPQPLAGKIRSACYDCHSNETVYPWYSNIQPAAWFLKSHIEDGRKHLNFSTFATYEPKRQAHKLEESVEMLEKGEMPLESYTLMHDKAKLTAAERTAMISYFRQMQQSTRAAASER